MNHPTIWPATLWLVRHGESAGNVAREAADATGLEIIDIDVRDVDVPLSPLGELQAVALGKWFARMPEDARPNVVLSSPYKRALRTAELIVQYGKIKPVDPSVPIIVDEEQILAIDREREVANCSVTRYDNDTSRIKHGKLELTEFNFVAPLEDEGAPVTSAPDF